MRTPGRRTRRRRSSCRPARGCGSREDQRHPQHATTDVGNRLAFANERKCEHQDAGHGEEDRRVDQLAAADLEKINATHSTPPPTSAIGSPSRMSANANTRTQDTAKKIVV